MNVRDEARLLLRAQQGDLEAFEQFVRLFERRIRGLLSRLLQDERDVDEAAQDTFVQAWRHLGRFRGDAAPFTWLYRIAVNEALQRTRRKHLETQPLDDDLLDRVEYRQSSSTSRSTLDRVEERATQEFLLSRVRSLSLEMRLPLVLRDIEGWSNADVADALDLSVAATKSRIHRARMQIREELDSWLHRRT